MRKTDRGGNWMRYLSIVLIIAVCAAAIPIQHDSADARTRERVAGTTPPSYFAKPNVAFPVYEYRLHSVGQVWFTPTNFGLLGIGNSTNPLPDKDLGPLGINYSPSFQFPAGTRNEYLYAGGLYVGGIVGTDTLVSMPIRGQSEEIDEWHSFDTVKESSSLRTSPYFDRNAVAQQQFYSVMSDTFIGTATDEVDSRSHRPLNIEVSQRSYAWSDRFSRQFIIMEYWIRNIGVRPISKMAMGIYMDADVFNDETSDGITGSNDDFSGFLLDGPSQVVEGVNDYLNIAWVADNDGDPVGGSFPRFSPRGCVGMRIIHSPPVEDLSFNWWLLGAGGPDWGPTKQGSRTGGASGSFVPAGDRNVYYVMTNGERDYGQLFANIDQTADGWRPPPRSGGCDIADGLDTRQLLSVGPTLDPLLPGDSVPFVVAFMGGLNFHTNPRLQFQCENPTVSLASLDFSDLIFSASWSSWIYDAPGIDSDGDGYRGEYHLVGCDSTVNGISYGCDTVYFTGDLGPPPGPKRALMPGPPNIGGGAPDFAGPEAPPCPQVSIETRPSEIIVRWTGRESETRPDPILRQPDFEEYRLYIGRINTQEQYSLVGSWDIIDFNTYVYDTATATFVREGLPMQLEQFQARYGDDFDPRDYLLSDFRQDTIGAFYDSVFSGGTLEEVRILKFAKQSFNQGNQYVDEFGNTVDNLIQKLGDSTVVDELTGDTLRFGYYEARITNMNASIGQYISVTAWDFGNPFQRLDPAESGGGPGTTGCTDFAIPIYSADVVVDSGLQVSVFPNPYKIRFDGPDGQPTSYFEQGFEAPQKFGTESGIAEQDRRIWFINLPDTATIKIYTLDGDLVRTIEHIDPKASTSTTSLSDYSSRTAWDLVTRNAQAAVSGLYIWRVESSHGSQTGKLVIIK
ncbi:MAG: hypothetical protein Kow0074_06810 [Candidatus Zixiibacteriota bacterium]